MRIAICDDEKRICDLLFEKVKGFFPDAEVSQYTSGADLLRDETLPDILLLDIGMPEPDGMKVAEMLRDRGWRKILIFVTGEENQVFHSFDLHAFHFLVKPVSDEKLKSVLESAMEELGVWEKAAASQERYISIQSGTVHIQVRLSQLIFAEVYDRKTVIHMLNDSIEYYGQLSVLEKVVGKGFYRTHRSYLVNLGYVDRYDRTSLTLQSGDVIPIARREYEGFLKAYMEYICGRSGS